MVLTKTGLSKNTYIKTFREAFPDFKGIQLDVQGVKSVKNVTEYLFKDVAFQEVFKLFKGEGRDLVHRNDDLTYFLTNLKNFKYFKMINEIQKYPDIEMFLQSKFGYGINYITDKTKITQCFYLSRFLIPIKLVAHILLQHKSAPDKKRVINTINKHNIKQDHLEMLQYILFFLIVKEGVLPHILKSKNLIVVSYPNTGKTSLITKLNTCLKRNEIFFFLGRRKNDFTGYSPQQNPILVFDDILEYPKLNWDTGTLLKVLGHEEFKVDIKYGLPINVVPSNRVIFTNNWIMFSDKKHSNLEQRVKTLKLTESVNWLEIPDDDFMNLCQYLIIEFLETYNRREEAKKKLLYGIEYKWLDFKIGGRDVKGLHKAIYRTDPTATYKDGRGNTLNFVHWKKLEELLKNTQNPTVIKLTKQIRRECKDLIVWKEPETALMLVYNPNFTITKTIWTYTCFDNISLWSNFDDHLTPEIFQQIEKFEQEFNRQLPGRTSKLNFIEYCKHLGKYNLFTEAVEKCC